MDPVTIIAGVSAVKGITDQLGIFDQKKQAPPECKTSLFEMEKIALNTYKKYNTANGAFIYSKIRESGISDICGDRIKQAMSNVLPKFVAWRKAQQKEKEQAQAQAQAGSIPTVLNGQPVQPISAVYQPGISGPAIGFNFQPYIIPAIAGVLIYFVFLRK